MDTRNGHPTGGAGHDPAAELLARAGQIFQPPSPETRARIWARMQDELGRSQTLPVRRWRLGRLATAASLLLAAGFAGFAAGWGGLAGRLLGRDQNPAVARQAPAPAGRQADPANPKPDLGGGPGHPVAITSFQLVDGDRVLPLLPKDPLRPFAHHDWFYPVPAHMTDCQFDPAKRILKFKLRQTASPGAVERARREIAHAYARMGRAGVKPEDINIQPLQRVGYRLALATDQGDLLLKERHDVIHSGKMPVIAEIPPGRKALIDFLTADPDYVSVVATGFYDFEFSSSASAEAQGLRSASLKALEEIYGGKPLTGPVLVDRRGKQEYLSRMRNEVVVWSRESGLEADSVTDLVLKRLEDIQPISFRDFLDQRGQLLLWNPELARLELKPEEYNLLTQETRKLLEEQNQARSLSKEISDLATHKQDEGKFYDRLRETFRLHAKAKGDVVGIFSADLAMDLDKSYDQLSQGEKKAVSDYRRSASNESEFESKYVKKSDESFRGKNHVAGSTPKGWDLYLINDEATVGETLFGSHQVKLLGVKSVAVSEEFPIEVEKGGDEPPASTIAARPGAEFQIGSTQNYAGRTETIPEGYLACDGRDVERARYPELFRRIGTLYGRGDGQKTFNLPDYRGEFLRGADDMGTARGARGVDGGRIIASSQTDAFQQHAHGQNLTVNVLHTHRVKDVYHIAGNSRPLEIADGQPYSGQALIAGYPYGFARTPETPVSPDGTPAGIHAGPRQVAPFQGGHKLQAPDADGHLQDDRWAMTTPVGNPKQPVEGSIGGADRGRHADETRPRNVATLVIIRAE